MPPPASPTLSPGTLTVAEAGAALLAVEGRLDDVRGAARAKYSASASCAGGGHTPCDKTEMKAGKEYWAIVADALAEYIEGVEAIRFPDVAASAAAAHLESAVIFRDRARSASQAKTLARFNVRAAAAADARDNIFGGGVQPLKDALGLPVGP